jgi:hypothetical protein
LRIQFEELKSTEIDQVLDMHNAHYSDKRTVKQFNWEYKSNLSDNFVFTVVKKGNVIVGTQGMIPILVNVGGVSYLSGKSENSYLDSGYRGGTTFGELYNYAISLCKAKGMICIWGITPAIKTWQKKLGFSVYPEAKYTAFLILRPKSFISKIIKYDWSLNRKIVGVFSSLPIYFYSAVRRYAHFSFHENVKFSIEERLGSITDIEDLYRRLKLKQNFIHIQQDENYLNWRIFNNPNNIYTTYFLYKADQLKAYSYLSINSEKDAYLSDFTFEDYEAGEILLKKILAKLISCNAKSVLFMGNIKNHVMAETFQLLKKYGFLKKRDSEAFALLNLSYEDSAHLNDIKNWYINGLWTEGYTW